MLRRRLLWVLMGLLMLLMLLDKGMLQRRGALLGMMLVVQHLMVL